MASSKTRLRLNPRRVKRCESQKEGFATRDGALYGAERMMEAGRVNPGCHIVPYACTLCGEWHVANKQIVLPPGEWPRARKADGGLV